MSPTGDGHFWGAQSRYYKLLVQVHTAHTVPAHWKGIFVGFFESVRVLSCVRPVALIFQHDLFFFHCLGAALADR